MVNDDWSFYRAFEVFKATGRIADTGWGPPNAPGGPALIAQLVWAAPFSWVWGTSPTVMRMAVLTLAVLGSLGLIGLLMSFEIPPLIALFATLTIILNPLFLSQSFSFMTDIPLASFMMLSLWLLFLGMRRTSVSIISLGLLLSLCATLTRQVGIVIPVAFAASSIISPAGRAMGRLRPALLVAGLCVLPWLAYELFLWVSESTPITEHQLVQGIYYDIIAKGFIGSLTVMSGHLAVALLYTGFSISPLLLLISVPRASSPAFRTSLRISLVMFALVEASVLLGIFDPPSVFSPNVIYNFGIGPVLLKDTYILGITRNWIMPPSVYCAVVYWAFVSVLLAARYLVIRIKSQAELTGPTNQNTKSFFVVLSIVSILLYLGIYLFTGFHDRYLIPLVIMSLILLCSCLDLRSLQSIPWTQSLVALVLLAFIGGFSVFGLHDFMSMKRALCKAHKYITVDLREDPCNVDGGFEFNGYNCYQKCFRPQKGFSWWWVNREDYVVTLGPLDGYRVVRVFPFKRLMGVNGAVNVLSPSAPAPK